ncbi:MAG: hypothetical protein KAT34_06555 [Candidatus Aminicenantes bacterium]|nr:hypothetical protein [Candidatus Aminicenantes bacterium]
MNSVRKITGVLIILFFALPILFGIIWAVGITKAVVSPEFLSDMPREFIAEVPQFVDDMLEAMQEEDFTTNENARAWLKAINEAGTSPKELMEEIGLLGWMQNELSASLQDVGDILRGEMEAKQITLNMIPLKEALQHKAIDLYIMNLLKKFPPCDLDQVEAWQDSDVDDDLFDSLPACQPDPLIVSEALDEWRRNIDYDIPDEVDIFEGARFFPRGFSTARTVVSLTYLLFLIPAAFIAIGALIGASSRQGFLQWTGVTTIIGGLIPLGMAIFAKKIVPLALHWAPYDYSHEISIQFQEMALEKIGGLMSVVFDQLFSPVIAVAGTVCIVGIILYALSFAVTPASTEPVRETLSAEPKVESKTGEEPEKAEEKKE